MTTTFKNAHLTVATTSQDLYTCPSGTTAIVIGLQAYNQNAAAHSVTALLYDASATTTRKIVSGYSIPANTSVGLVSGKLVLEAGDKLQVLSSSTSTEIDVIASVTELS
jgi:hypothetical protein